MHRRRWSRPDSPLAFPTEHAARERARDQFGIDVEQSLRGWFLEMGLTPDVVEALAEHRGEGNGLWMHGKPGTGRRDEDDLTLTPRQRETISYIACGYTRDEAAAHMGIAMETVKRHLDLARFRLRAVSQTHLVLLAILVGEIDAEIVNAHMLRTWDDSA